MSSKTKTFTTISRQKRQINKCMINMDSNDEIKKINIKNCTLYYFKDMINIEDFHLDNILIDKKSYENILVFNISYKTLIDANLCVLCSIK